MSDLRPITSNLVFTRLAQRRGSALDFEVQTDDLGNNNQGGVRLFDDKGHVLDAKIGDPKPGVQATWRPEGTDDLFQITVSTQALVTAGFVPTDRIGSTAFVDVDGDRIWEGAVGEADVYPEQFMPDTLSTLAGQPGMRDVNRTFNGADITLGLASISNQGDKSWSGTTGVRSIRLDDTAGAFAGVNQIQALVMPIVRSTDRRVHGDFLDPHPDYVTKTVMDLRSEALVTLTRQPDGSFQATAPAGKTFNEVEEAENYMGGSALSAGFEVAFVDPVTNEWVKDGTNNFVL
jgi:hypothetical protein